jgi:hypothetical protein
MRFPFFFFCIFQEETNNHELGHRMVKVVTHYLAFVYLKSIG